MKITSPIKLTLCAAAVLLCISSVQASTIVKWGESGGDTNIVTAHAAKGAAAGSTYAVVSPADGTSGYSTNVAGQTRIVYGAGEVWNNNLILNSGAGDYMQLVKNFGGTAGTFTTMLAWESQDFLATDRELESMSVNYGSRGGVGTTAFFLIETGTGWYKSVESNFVSNTSTANSWTNGVADLTWESFGDATMSGITSGVGAADITDIQSAGVYFSAENSAGNNWAGTKVAYFEVTATARSIVQSNTTYATFALADAATSSNDLINVGQPTLDSFTVSANQGGDGAADNGFIDGITSNEFANMTWFNNNSSQLPATNTVLLDVTTNTGGYDISEINSIAGWHGGEQADQILTVEYSVVGNAGFTSLGTFTNTAAGTAEYSRLNLIEESGGYLATGVDALRFTYAATGKHLVLQEIDVIGVAATVAQPTVQLELASMFSDDMILQREKAVPVWGTSTPGAAITVEFAGQTNTTTAASNGTWQVDLDPMVASTNARTLTVTAELEGFETTVVSFSNVLVGEVWLCSGQSNMALTIAQTVHKAEVEATPDNSMLRFFKVPQVTQDTPLERLDTVWTESTTGSAGTARSFGAAAYFFGLKLQDELESSEGAKDVPIGLIHSARGGTTVEVWLPAGTSYNGGAAGGRYNGQIDAIIPFAMRGVIWYQGESNLMEDGNDGQPLTYVDKKKALINGWRSLWGEGFPFYYVQIAPFDYTANAATTIDDGVLPFFWEAQSAVLGEVTNTGMAVITDSVTDSTGATNLNELHPRNKEVPGTRLALLALDNTYGQDIVSTGPVFQSLKTVGNTLEVLFDSADGLTTSDSQAPDWFELAGVDGVYTSATAVVNNNMVILSATGVDVPTAMRFAWRDIAQPNLRNGAGLVASSFRAVTSWGMWSAAFGLSGSNAVYSANPDGDALDNLGEYALGGNPTNDDASAVLPDHFMANPAGTNWLYLVHNERTDDPGLEYTVRVSTNLVSNVWKTNGVEFAGSSVVSNDWKTVTNRTEAVEDAKFISLRVEL